MGPRKKPEIYSTIEISFMAKREGNALKNDEERETIHTATEIKK